MAFDSDDDKKLARAGYIARETGITERNALSLIERIGMDDLPALLREARLLARWIAS